MLKKNLAEIGEALIDKTQWVIPREGLNTPVETEDSNMSEIV